jgi:hypothetical protein
MIATLPSIETQPRQAESMKRVRRQAPVTKSTTPEFERVVQEFIQKLDGIDGFILSTIDVLFQLNQARASLAKQTAQLLKTELRAWLLYSKVCRLEKKPQAECQEYSKIFWQFHHAVKALDKLKQSIKTTEEQITALETKYLKLMTLLSDDEDEPDQEGGLS